MTYSEKLRDPRWQKLRLEVFHKSDFACELCGDTESTLHAHHKAYLKGRDPWDYKIGQIACLCESCHENIHAADPDWLTQAISYAPLDGPWNRDELATLILGILEFDPEEIFKIIPDTKHRRALFEFGYDMTIHYPGLKNAQD